MIINTCELDPKMQQIAAQKISNMSHEPGSSLLPRSANSVIKELQSGTTLAKVIDDKIIFTIAFEPTGCDGYIEIGMICNLDRKNVRGKDLFPEIISHYRSHNGNGSHNLYLTTNNVRMLAVAESSDFEKVQNIYTAFPKDVIKFCCTPCTPQKTGVKKMGDQVNYCPRFFAEFFPHDCTDETHLPCVILVQYVP